MPSFIAVLLASAQRNFGRKSDDIEGARQAGVIKTNLVPFARGNARQSSYKRKGQSQIRLAFCSGAVNFTTTQHEK